MNGCPDARLNGLCEPLLVTQNKLTGGLVGTITASMAPNSSGFHSDFDLVRGIAQVCNMVSP